MWDSKNVLPPASTANGADNSNMSDVIGNKVDLYVIQLGTGVAGSQVFWGESAFSRDTNQNRVAPIGVQGYPIPAGTKLWARLASEGGGGDSCKIKVYTHQYLSVTGA